MECLYKNPKRKGVAPTSTAAVTLDEANRLYQEGQTVEEIARAFGVPEEALRRRMIRAGIQMRSKGPRRAETNFQWKGGYTPPMHYYRRQSYEVAAICLGRPLSPGVVIHHIDEDATNNQPENLILFPSQRLHCHYHQRLLRLQRQGQPVDAIQLALEIGGVRLPPPPAPIVFAPDIKQRGPYKSPPSPGQGQTTLLPGLP